MISGCLAENGLHRENEKYDMLYKSNTLSPRLPIFPTGKYSPLRTSHRFGNSFDINDKFPFKLKKNWHKRNLNRIRNVPTNHYPIKRDDYERIKDAILDTDLESGNRRFDAMRQFLLSSLKKPLFALNSKRSENKPVKNGGNQSTKKGSKDEFDSNSYFMLRPLKRYSIKDNKISRIDHTFGKLSKRAYFIYYIKLSN